MKRLLLIFSLLVSVCVSAQIDNIIPAKPSKSEGLVIDYTNTLTAEQKQALNQKLILFDDSSSSQVAVVMIGSLQGYDVAEYAIALGRKWGVGGSEFNNGVILLVAMDDHKSRIEVGYGLEGAIPDVTAKSILDNDITPNFKEKNYYRGLDQATDNIIKAAAGEYKAPSSYGQKKKRVGLGTIIVLIILFLIFGAMGGGRRGGGTLSGAGWIIGGMLGGSGGGGSSSSGGFGGFGGGSFGGGGASGSW